MAARGRVPVRAPGGALGDRRHRADHAPEGAARALPLRLGRGAALDPHACCASTSPSISRTWRHRERRRLRAVADRLLPGGRSPASRSRSRPRRSPRRCCWRCSARCSSAARGRCWTSRCPGSPRASGARSRDSQLDAVPSAEVAAMREIDATLRIEATDNANALASVDPARMARWARAQAPLREVRLTKRWAITLWPTPAAAQQAGMGTRELEEFVERALFLDRDDPVAAWGELRAFQAGLIERLAPGGRSTSRAGHRPAPQRRGPDVGQLRRQAQHAVGRGLHRAARDVRRGRDPLHDPDRAARRGRRGRDAGVPRGPRGQREGRARRRLPAGDARHRRRRPLPGRARHRHQLRHRPPDRRDPVRREDRRHRPPGARPLLSGDRRHQRVRRALGHDLRPAPGRHAERRRRAAARRRCSSAPSGAEHPFRAA